MDEAKKNMGDMNFWIELDGVLDELSIMILKEPLTTKPLDILYKIAAKHGFIHTHFSIGLDKRNAQFLEERLGSRELVLTTLFGHGKSIREVEILYDSYTRFISNYPKNKFGRYLWHVSKYLPPDKSRLMDSAIYDKLLFFTAVQEGQDPKFVNRLTLNIYANIPLHEETFTIPDSRGPPHTNPGSSDTRTIKSLVPKQKEQVFRLIQDAAGEFNILFRTSNIIFKPFEELKELSKSNCIAYELVDLASVYEMLAGMHECTKKCERCSMNAERAKLLKCSRCKAAYYCDKVCQKADWERHERICTNRIRASSCVPP